MANSLLDMTELNHAYSVLQMHSLVVTITFIRNHLFHYYHRLFNEMLNTPHMRCCFSC